MYCHITISESMLSWTCDNLSFRNAGLVQVSADMQGRLCMLGQMNNSLSCRGANSDHLKVEACRRTLLLVLGQGCVCLTSDAVPQHCQLLLTQHSHTCQHFARSAQDSERFSKLCVTSLPCASWICARDMQQRFMCTIMSGTSKTSCKVSA